MAFEKKSSREDWIREGLEILYRDGAENLTIERLCGNLKKTKGAFYHHFKSRDDFSAELLSFWEKNNTDHLVRLSGRSSSTTGKMARLSALSRNLPRNPERAIRAWAIRNDAAAEFQERVDQKRTAYLRMLFAELGEDRSSSAASAIYCMFIGAMMVLPEIKGHRLRKLYALVPGIFPDTTNSRG